MSDINYIFQISPYDKEKLLPQVSKALEKRTELVSREKYPGLWKHIDNFNAMAKGRSRSRLRTRLLSIVYLAVGIFLFVPGLVKPKELIVPLLAGLAGIVAGIIGLWRSRKRRRNPFDKSAKLLLAGTDAFSSEKDIRVVFTENEMIFAAGNDNKQMVPYADFECVVETTDTLLLVYNGRVTLLKKQDFVTDKVNEFCKFISEKVKRYQVVF